MRLCVYTAIAGRFDQLREPRVRHAGIDFVAFSDSAKPVRGWDVRKLVAEATTPRRTARLHKLQPHRVLPGYDAWLWLDGCYEIRRELGPLLRSWLKMRHDVTLRRHPWRRPLCAYEEARACVKAEKGDPAEMAAQMARYRELGYPENNGMVVTGILLRKNTPAVQAFSDAWWAEVQRGSDRDQLSFNFTAWQTGIGFNLVAPPDATSDHKPYLRWTDHGR